VQALAFKVIKEGGDLMLKVLDSTEEVQPNVLLRILMESTYRLTRFDCKMGMATEEERRNSYA